MSRQCGVILLAGLLATAVPALADIPPERRAPVVPVPESSAQPQRAKPRTGEGEMPRGQLLYENHCQGCHTSVAHVRERRRAQSVSAIQAWVRRWAAHQQLGWSDSDVADVTDYLNRRYYKLPMRSPP